MIQIEFDQRKNIKKRLEKITVRVGEEEWEDKYK